MFEKKNQVCNRVWRQTPLIPALGSSDLCELEASLVHTGKLCLKTINKQTKISLHLAPLFFLFPSPYRPQQQSSGKRVNTQHPQVWVTLVPFSRSPIPHWLLHLPVRPVKATAGASPLNLAARELRALPILFWSLCCSSQESF